MRPHGTRSRYGVEGCRCPACTAAASRYQHRLKRIQLEEHYGARPSRFVDPVEAQDHLLKLQAAGIGSKQVSALCGISRSAVNEIRNGCRARIRRQTADAILGVCLDEHCTPHALVDAKPAHRAVERMQRAGLTKKEIAHALGCQSSLLHNPSRGRCRLRTLLRIQELERTLAMQGGAS